MESPTPPANPPLRPYRASRAGPGIDRNVPQQRQVDHESAFTDREPCDVVAAAAHGTEKPVLTREPNGLHYIDRPGATSHQTGAAIDHGVPDLPGLVVLRIPGSHHLPLEPGLEGLQGLRGDIHNSAVEARELARHEMFHSVVCTPGILDVTRPQDQFKI